MSHILIADDDTDLTDGLTWYLEAEGYRVEYRNVQVKPIVEKR